MDDLIATHYRLASPPAQITLGGLAAYAVTDRRESTRPLLAIQTHPALPPRARLLSGRAAAPLPGAVMPLDHGPGRLPAGTEAYFVICPELPGSPIGADPHPWPETDIIRSLLLPAAATLDALAERGITHRAINPANIFRPGPGEKVTLGPCWAAPPASLQPGAFEPPYSAQCLAASRGEGSIADDVYALGVTILWCALGSQNPMLANWAEEDMLLRRKITQGSLAALAGAARLSSSLADLLRGMLAEDPDHRPAPSLLLDPEQARGRRVAMRPAMRAQRPLEVAGEPAWYARELALLMAKSSEAGAALLRNGAVDIWLRRLVGDSQLALRLEEAMARLYPDASASAPKPAHAIVARGVAALDPLAPLVWRGHAVFPDGLGTALAFANRANQPALAAALEEVVSQDVITGWSIGRAQRPELVRTQQEVRDWRSWLSAKGMTGGLPRVLYSANVLMSCASPLLEGRAVARLPDLLPALDDAAAATDRKRPPIDPHIAAFIAARADTSVLADAGRLGSLRTRAERLGVIALYGRLQQRLVGERLPHLAGWLLGCGLIDLGQWRSLATRKRLEQQLAELAAAGQIAPIAALLQDGAGRAQDEAGARQAAQRLSEIAGRLDALEKGTDHRTGQAQQTGQEIAIGLSLISLLGGALAVALGG